MTAELTPAYVHDEELEAIRALVRQRQDVKEDLKRAKNRLGKFLLRNGVSPTQPLKPWSTPHRQWLDTVHMEQPAQRLVMREHLAALDPQKERLKRLEQTLAAQQSELPEWRQQQLGALVCLHGVKELTAPTVLVETGELDGSQRRRRLSVTRLPPRCLGRLLGRFYFNFYDSCNR